MSDELSDLNSIEEHQIFLGKKTDFKENKSEETKKKNKKVKSKLNEKQELKSSDSKEYVEEEEEEEEESNEIGDSDSNEDDISKSQLGHNKKRKLDDENQGPGWSRTWKDNNSNNDNKSISSSSAIVDILNKTDKNNEENNNNDKITDNKLINEQPSSMNNIISLKKTSFIITSPDNKSSNNLPQNKYLFNNQNRNNYTNINNKQIQNTFAIPENQNQYNRQNIEDKKNIFNSNIIPNNNLLLNNLTFESGQTNKYIFSNIYNLDKLNKVMEEKFRKYRIDKNLVDQNQILNFLTKNLLKYIRTYLTRLITISRIRNVNFHLYSNNPSGQIHYKFRTYNSQLSEDKKNLTFKKGKDLDILFTSNLKKEMDSIEEYVELNNKKIKFEKLSSCKEKDEDNDKIKGIESIKITEGPNPTIKLLPGRRTKKKNNSFIKEVRKKLVQTQKKEDLIKQNSNTKSTLEAFLNDTDTSFKNKNKSKNINSLLDDDKMNSKLDLSSRMSDNMSNMYSYTNNNNFNQMKNEIDMNVYNSFDLNKNENFGRGQKRRINLKDFIFMLENSNEFIPQKSFMLNRASFEHLKKYI